MKIPVPNSVFCLWEKLRIFLQAALRMPNDRKVLRVVKRFLRTDLRDFASGDSLFLISPRATSKGALVLLEKVIEERIDEQRTKLLLVTHELSLSGAPKAALMFALAFRATNGAPPLVLAMKDGPMDQEFRKEGIPLITRAMLPSQKADVVSFFSRFDAVVINSVAWELLANLKHIRPPKIWWSHEIFVKDKDIELVKDFAGHLDLYLAGSPLVLQDLKEKVDLGRSDYLLYGCDEAVLPPRRADGTLTFALLGAISRRKGTDVFIKAVQMLPEKVRKGCKFLIVGEGTSESFYHDMVKLAQPTPEITFVPNVPFEELLQIYADSDVVVSTSRIDPMPIVLTYALMFSKLCVCTNTIGTALLVENEIDGMVFESENPGALSALIERIHADPAHFSTIAAAGRSVFLKHFSKKTFETRIKDILETMKPANPLP